MKGGKIDCTGYLKFRSKETGGFDAYLGNFKEGKPMGNGIYDSSQGWRFQGWFDGAFDSGEGTLKVEKDNAVVRGKFKDGKPDGMVLVTKDDGTQLTETWKNGEKRQ